jgi:hypothetical protein
MTDPTTTALTTGIVWLAVLAVVNTMPEQPPSSLRALPVWAYQWAHDALKTFVSYRGPAK